MTRCLTCSALIPSGTHCPEHAVAITPVGVASTRCLGCKELTDEGSFCPRCRPLGKPRGAHWQRVIVPAVLDRDRHRCTMCTKPCPHPRHHDIDHIVDLHNGGTNAMTNLRTLCASTNRGGRCK